MELADVLDSKSSGSDTVPVRPRSPAPTKRPRLSGETFFVGAGCVAVPEENIPTDESAEAPVKTKKKSRKKKRASEVEDGAAE